MSGISIFGHVPAIVPGIVGIVAVPISIIGMGTGILLNLEPLHNAEQYFIKLIDFIHCNF